MNFVNWYTGSKTDKKPNNTVMWKDIVTETVFYIHKNKAREIEEKAIKYINSLKDIEDLSDYLYGKNDKKANEVDEDIRLFPQLPCTAEGNENTTSYRISDHVVIRTGILCSKFGYSKNIREYGLLKDINIFSDTLPDRDFVVDNEVEKAFEIIENVLRNRPVSEEECNKYKFDIVKGGAVKVKQYYMETNKIKDIRGASRILDEINRITIPGEFAKMYSQESIIYCGGGNILGVFPEGKGKELCSLIEEVYEREAVTAQSATGFKSCSLWDIREDNYLNTMSDLTLCVTDRQMAKFQADVNPYYKIEDSHVCKDSKICSHCNIREAHYDTSDGESLCTSCYKKVINGGRDSANDFKKSYLAKCNEKDIKIKTVKQINTLNDISKFSSNGDYIAVIYGDGNNMGSIIQNVKNLGQMRYFSEESEKAVFDAVYMALGNVLKHDAFEIIAIGGDDIFMIVPASSALKLGSEIGRLFDEKFMNKSENTSKVTMSIGIAISHSNTPIQYLFELSQQLLKNAKKKTKKILKYPGVNKGTLDVMALETESGVGASLRLLRSQMIKDTNKRVVDKTSVGSGVKYRLNNTMRPYTWDETEALIDAVNTLKTGELRSKAYNFRQASFDMDIDEAELYYLYNMSKTSNNKTFEYIEKAVNIIKSGFDASESDNRGISFMIKNEGEFFYSPWGDIVELWDYCK